MRMVANDDSHHHPHQPPIRRTWPLLAACLLAALTATSFPGTVLAEDAEASMATTAAESTGEAEEKSEDCEFECVKWGEQCFHDIRTGRYRCRRTCDKFAEVCAP